jgi:hypothetical protein
MEVQEDQGKKRHAAAMDRMKKRHAREVQIEVQEAKVELEGALRTQTRQVRQSKVELEKVQKDHSKVPSP